MSCGAHRSDFAARRLPVSAELVIKSLFPGGCLFLETPMPAAPLRYQPCALLCGTRGAPCQACWGEQRPGKSWRPFFQRGYGATAARLTPDQKVGSSNLSALISLPPRTTARTSTLAAWGMPCACAPASSCGRSARLLRRRRCMPWCAKGWQGRSCCRSDAPTFPAFGDAPMLQQSGVLLVCVCPSQPAVRGVLAASAEKYDERGTGRARQFARVV